MIHATADQIKEIIVADPTLLRELHRFLQAVDIDNDLVAMLGELPAAIAVHSPFADEAALTETVRREMLAALHGLSLRRLPPQGNA
jgi:hypothetical protein